MTETYHLYILPRNHTDQRKTFRKKGDIAGLCLEGHESTLRKSGSLDGF